MRRAWVMVSGGFLWVFGCTADERHFGFAQAGGAGALNGGANGEVYSRGGASGRPAVNAAGTGAVGGRSSSGAGASSAGGVTSAGGTGDSSGSGRAGTAAQDTGGASSGVGGSPVTGGVASVSGGAIGVGGRGGAPSAGGAPSTAGASGTGGAPSTGGASGTGGAPAMACGFSMPNPVSSGLPNLASYDTTVAGVVTDKVTGLVWERTVSSQTFTPAQAAAYCTANRLNARSDWRLPTVLELTSLVDFTIRGGGTVPVIDGTAFPGTPTASFTTSIPVAGTPGKSWSVDFWYGKTEPGTAIDSLRARCVRSGPAPTPSRCYSVGARYVASTVSGALLTADLATGLIWQQTPSPQAMTWGAVANYCTGLPGGFRAPSMKELQTLIDYTVASPGPAIDQVAFPGFQADFWTSSRDPENASVAWFVMFDTGAVSWNGASTNYYVRCVR